MKLLHLILLTATATAAVLPLNTTDTNTGYSIFARKKAPHCKELGHHCISNQDDLHDRGNCCPLSGVVCYHQPGRWDEWIRGGTCETWESEEDDPWNRVDPPNSDTPWGEGPDDRENPDGGNYLNPPPK